MGSVLVSIFAINEQFPFPQVGQLQQETVSFLKVKELKVQGWKVRWFKVGRLKFTGSSTLSPVTG
jgi:hypothetical protein